MKTPYWYLNVILQMVKEKTPDLAETPYLISVLLRINTQFIKILNNGSSESEIPVSALFYLVHYFHTWIEKIKIDHSYSLNQPDILSAFIAYTILGLKIDSDSNFWLDNFLPIMRDPLIYPALNAYTQTPLLMFPRKHLIHRLNILEKKHLAFVIETLHLPSINAITSLIKKYSKDQNNVFDNKNIQHLRSDLNHISYTETKNLRRALMYDEFLAIEEKFKTVPQEEQSIFISNQMEKMIRDAMGARDLLDIFHHFKDTYFILFKEEKKLETPHLSALFVQSEISSSWYRLIYRLQEKAMQFAYIELSTLNEAQFSSMEVAYLYQEGIKLYLQIFKEKSLMNKHIGYQHDFSSLLDKTNEEHGYLKKYQKC